MNKGTLTTKCPQQHGNFNSLVPPEIRRQIRKLKRELEQHHNRLSVHQDLFSVISSALDTARQTASCLLTQDPFDAWAKIVKARDEEFELDFGVSTAEERETCRSVEATVKVAKLITIQMRQQHIVEANKKLEDYAGCLDQFLREVTQLKSFETALELAESLQRNEPLETWEGREGQKNGDGDECV